MATLGSSQRVSAASAEPVGDRVDGGVGLLEVDAVAGAGDDDELGSGETVDQTATEVGELRVVFADEHEHGTLDLAEAIPERGLCAGARRPEAGGETGRGVAEAILSSAVASVSPAKSGLASHSSMKVGTPTASMWSARRSSAARLAARSSGSSMPAVAPISTSRSTTSGRASAVCNATRPPIEYPT